MDTPPTASAPTMQMYLQHQPGTSYPDGDPFSPTNVGDEADTVYHEYTHGLSNRLVVDAAGISTLGNVQAGAMGEAWSDWYAMDYLVVAGSAEGPTRAGRPGASSSTTATACPSTAPSRSTARSASTSPRCPGGATGHRGGYTYADYGQVIGSPEVHADGEIWSQTLWDLRGELGSKLTESLVTRAMELSPANPSFLDERNAILLADTAVSGGHHRADDLEGLRQPRHGLLRRRLDGNDTARGDFQTPPAPDDTGTITGTVTDEDSGGPVRGCRSPSPSRGRRRPEPVRDRRRRR